MHSQVTKAILDGIYEAHKTQWKRVGKSIFSSVECVYLSKIADALDKVGYRYMNYGYKASKLIKDLEISPDRTITASNGKVDLLIRDNEKLPLAIVEIKAEYAKDAALEKDLFRICDFLYNFPREKYPNFFGVFAVGLTRYKEFDIREHIKESFKCLEEKIVKIKTLKKKCRYKCYERDLEDKGNIVWGDVCFVIHENRIED